tara:strand:+ start:96 stop:353 length:258 start_codon:yes stop_codon:yes gene_type:complete
LPQYLYYCQECKKEFTKRHSYKDVLDECSLCNSRGSIEKLLNKPINFSKKIEPSYKKPGVLTQQAIEEMKEEVKQEKETLRKRKK